MQDHHLLYQVLPDNPGDIQETSTMNIFQQCLFYYYGIKLFRDNIQSDFDKCDGPNPKHDDKLLVTIFDVTPKREWQEVQQMDPIIPQLDSYANN